MPLFSYQEIASTSSSVHCVSSAATPAVQGAFFTHHPSAPHQHHRTFIHCLCDTPRWQMTEEEKRAVECKVLRSKSDEKIIYIYIKKKKGNTTVDEMLLVCNSWRDTVTRLARPVFTLTDQCNLRSLFLAGQCFQPLFLSFPPFISSPTSPAQCYIENKQRMLWLCKSNKNQQLTVNDLRPGKDIFNSKELLLCNSSLKKKNNSWVRNPVLLSKCRVCFQTSRSL